MVSSTGISTLGTYGTGTNSDKIQSLLDLIPDPDTLGSSGASAGGGAGAGFLDEMSPSAAVQLRVELAALQADIDAGEGDRYANGSYTAIAGDATANEITIDTGLTTEDALGTIIVDIKRSGVSVKADALVTDNEDGTFTISEVSTYAVTAGDIVTWFAELA